ncbi:MAG TPA: GAF domain-containing sensor histidine kinase [Spirochaetota bacterium]|nr:GAF domain-containing sensor histidine kinase [Spirochaetota bacterium]
MKKESLLFFNETDLIPEPSFTDEERSILNHINLDVAGSKSLDEILDFIFGEIKKIIPCDRIDVAFIEEDNLRMEIQFVKSDYEPVYLKKGFASDIIGGSIQKVFLSGMPSVINDMELHARSNPMSESARMLLKEGIKSSMVCPLKSEDRYIGMFMCRSRKPDAYGIHQISLQMAYAHRLGQAVEKAYRIAELSTAMSSYMEMLSFVSHELKNPLASIVMTAKTLAGGYYGEIAGKQKQAADRIIRKAEYLLNLTAEYLSLASIETGEFQVRPREVDFFRDVVAHSLEIINMMFQEKQIKFEQNISPDLPVIKCDPELLKIVLTNFLSNAVKYSNRGAVIKLNINADAGRIKVSVWNEGPGFPESEKIRLFKRFSILQTPELSERKGHGVGLYVTWKIILLHGGRIWADSKHGEWAEFTFEIPQLMDQCILH